VISNQKSWKKSLVENVQPKKKKSKNGNRKVLSVYNYNFIFLNPQNNDNEPHFLHNHPY